MVDLLQDIWNFQYSIFRWMDERSNQDKNKNFDCYQRRAFETKENCEGSLWLVGNIPTTKSTKRIFEKKVGYSWSIVQNNWSTSGKMQVQIEGTFLARWYQKERKTDYRFDWKFQ